MSAESCQVAQERAMREALVDLLLGVLDVDPHTRWTPRQALQHPFITGGIFQVRWTLQRVFRVDPLVVQCSASCCSTPSSPAAFPGAHCDSSMCTLEG